RAWFGVSSSFTKRREEYESAGIAVGVAGAAVGVAAFAGVAVAFTLGVVAPFFVGSAVGSGIVGAAVGSTETASVGATTAVGSALVGRATGMTVGGTSTAVFFPFKAKNPRTTATAIAIPMTGPLPPGFPPDGGAFPAGFAGGGVAGVGA